MQALAPSEAVSVLRSALAAMVGSDKPAVLDRMERDLRTLRERGHPDTDLHAPLCAIEALRRTAPTVAA